MFTGIIEEIGVVRSISFLKDAAFLSLESKECGSGSKDGDSISVNGCCLTIVERNEGVVSFEISQETLRASNLAYLKPGDLVNLERALAQGSRLGGHFVTGHIDYTGKLISKRTVENYLEFQIGIAGGFNGFFAEKGCVSIDGVSLTVNSVSESAFSVMLVPYTLSHTTLQYKDKASLLNIETDILAKYTFSLISKSAGSKTLHSNINKDFLSKYGFA